MRCLFGNRSVDLMEERQGLGQELERSVQAALLDVVSTHLQQVLAIVGLVHGLLDNREYIENISSVEGLLLVQIVVARMQLNAGLLAQRAKSR